MTLSVQSKHIFHSFISGLLLLLILITIPNGLQKIGRTLHSLLQNGRGERLGVGGIRGASGGKDVDASRENAHEASRSGVWIGSGIETGMGNALGCWKVDQERCRMMMHMDMDIETPMATAGGFGSGARTTNNAATMENFLGIRTVSDEEHCVHVPSGPPLTWFYKDQGDECNCPKIDFDATSMSSSIESSPYVSITLVLYYSKRLQSNQKKSVIESIQRVTRRAFAEGTATTATTTIITSATAMGGEIPQRQGQRRVKAQAKNQAEIGRDDQRQERAIRFQKVIIVEECEKGDHRGDSHGDSDSGGLASRNCDVLDWFPIHAFSSPSSRDQQSNVDILYLRSSRLATFNTLNRALILASSSKYIVLLENLVSFNMHQDWIQHATDIMNDNHNIGLIGTRHGSLKDYNTLGEYLFGVNAMKIASQYQTRRRIQQHGSRSRGHWHDQDHDREWVKMMYVEYVTGKPMVLRSTAMMKTGAYEVGFLRNDDLAPGASLLLRRKHKAEQKYMLDQLLSYQMWNHGFQVALIHVNHTQLHNKEDEQNEQNKQHNHDHEWDQFMCGALDLKAVRFPLDMVAVVKQKIDAGLSANMIRRFESWIDKLYNLKRIHDQAVYLNREQLVMLDPQEQEAVG